MEKIRELSLEEMAGVAGGQGNPMPERVYQCPHCGNESGLVVYNASQGQYVCGGCGWSGKKPSRTEQRKY